jgi:hypothetical protein
MLLCLLPVRVLVFCSLFSVLTAAWRCTGFKTMLYEGGVRVPGFVSGGHPLIPDKARGTVCTKLIHVTDWLPTIVGLAGGNTNRNRPLDGHDQVGRERVAVAFYLSLNRCVPLSAIVSLACLPR